MRTPFRCVAVVLLLAFAVLSQEPQFVFPLPAESAFVKHTYAYAKSRSGKDLSFDIYDSTSVGKSPLAIMLKGIGADWMRSHPQYLGWGRVVTAIGLSGITMDSEDGRIEQSFDSLMNYLRVHSAELAVDPERVVVYSCSANVKAGLPLVSSSGR